MEENSKTIIIKSNSVDNDRFDPARINEFLYLCLSKWKWFAFSLTLALALAFLYLKVTPPLFTRSASVHIKEDSKSSSISSITDEFSKLGLGNTSSSVNNEEVAFNSAELAEQVVKQLHLDVTYRAQHGLYKKMLYGADLPLTVQFMNLDDDEVQMQVTLQTSGMISIDSYQRKVNGEWMHDSQIENKEAFFGVPCGDLVFNRSAVDQPLTKPLTIYITKVPVLKATYDLHGHLRAVQNNTKNSVIDITYSDESIERAEAIINTLISEYNKNWVKDKNAMAVLTTQFIDERIKAIQQELGGVDSNIATYKSSNLITDPGQTAALLLSQANASDQQAMMLNNQIQMCSYLYDYIANAANVKSMIPANVGIQSENINTLVTAYNQKLLQRNTYANNSSDSNPLVQNLDTELEAQRSAILQSLTNEKKSLETQLQSSRLTVMQSTSKLSSAPTQEKNLLSMDRQQKVKESLYLFLLQKREENELSQAFTAYNTRVICRPMGLNAPSSPVSSSIYFVAIIIAVFLPIAILYLKELLNTKVRGREDIECLTVPFVGEIPQMKSKKKDIVVKQDCRDVLNEAFRIVRSNLRFMLSLDSEQRRQVVLVTSAVSGSGKSFLSINLASVFGIQKDTRVAVVDLDIRRMTLSKMVGKPELGVTDYLGGFRDDWHDLMHPLEEIPNVDVLSVGHIPPNPTELLQSDRLSKLLKEMRQEYDIIFLDMPPVDIVADVTIVKHLADITLFVVRVGYLERSMLPVIENYYKDKAFSNLAILLNGSEFHNRRYGYGRYSYGYGYSYHYST